MTSNTLDLMGSNGPHYIRKGGVSIKFFTVIACFLLEKVIREIDLVEDKCSLVKLEIRGKLSYHLEYIWTQNSGKIISILFAFQVRSSAIAGEVCLLEQKVRKVVHCRSSVSIILCNISRVHELRVANGIVCLMTRVLFHRIPTEHFQFA